jgi:hypothetical protein
MEGTPQPPPKPNYTMKPALIVGALAVVILVVFSVGSSLTHTAGGQPTVPKGASRVKGSSLLAVSAKAGLAPIETDGEPPVNVIDAITLPKGAIRGAITNPGVGSSYDQQVEFTIDASQEAVLGFYTDELHDLGWSTVTHGAATHQAGQQIVGQIAGDDGFYWQLGVVVAPTTFGASGTTDITQFTLRVLQVQDQD